MWAVPMLQKLDNTLAAIGAAAAALMMIHVVAEIVCRNILGVTLPATLEIVSLYYMPALIFLPLARVERLGGHIDVSFLQGRLPPFPRKLTEFFGYTVCGLIYAAMGWVGLQEALTKFAIREFLMGEVAIPLWPGRFLVPVGCFAIAAVIALKLVLGIRGRELEPQ